MKARAPPFYCTVSRAGRDSGIQRKRRKKNVSTRTRQHAACPSSAAIGPTALLSTSSCSRRKRVFNSASSVTCSQAEAAKKSRLRPIHALDMKRRAFAVQRSRQQAQDSRADQAGSNSASKLYAKACEGRRREWVVAVVVYMYVRARTAPPGLAPSLRDQQQRCSMTFRTQAVGKQKTPTDGRCCVITYIASQNLSSRRPLALAHPPPPRPCCHHCPLLSHWCPIAAAVRCTTAPCSGRTSACHRRSFDAAGPGSAVRRRPGRSLSSPATASGAEHSRVGCRRRDRWRLRNPRPFSG